MRLSVAGLTGGRTCGDKGYVTVGYVASVGLSLVLFVMLANLVVFQYGRGVVRAALDEGVRAGARAGDPAGACRARAGQVLGDLLGGTLGNGVRLHCAQGTDRVEADAEVVFPGWLPTVPDWRFTLRAAARRRGDTPL
jgi:hypothetical protein